MKTKPLEPLYLNLYNFDTSAAQDYPYVLTSPRSLEACRSSGFKPVELLYKSVEEYEEELTGTPLDEIYKIYQEQEKERQGKLERCRLLRKDLIQSGGKTKSTILKENSPPLLASENKKHYISRKEILDKENKARATVHKGEKLRLKTLENNGLYKNPTLETDVENGTRVLETQKSCTNFGAENTESHLSSTSDQHILRPLHLIGGAYNGDSDTGPKSGNLLKTRPSRPASAKAAVKRSASKKGDTSCPKRSSRPGSGTSGTHSRGSSGVSPRTPTPPQLPSNVKIPRTKLTRPSKASISQRSRTALKLTLKDFHDNNNNKNTCKKKQVSFSARRNVAEKYNLSPRRTVYSLTRPSNLVRVADRGILQRSLSGYMSLEDLCVPEHDRRILESMALKKELERDCDEFAYQAHLVWQADREKREQIISEQTVQWKEYVAEKRKSESEENSRRLEEIKISLKESQELLEKAIKEKEERTQRLLKEIEEKKKLELGDRSNQTAKRRAEVEAAYQQLQEEEAQWQQMVDEQQKLRLQKAESTRLQQRETYRRRVASANRVEELRHQDRWKRLKEETEASLQQIRQLCQMKEQKANENVSKAQQEKERQIKEQGLDRELRLQQVRRLHEELADGLQKWREQVMHLQWESLQQAEKKACEQVEKKRQRVGHENRARELHHFEMMKRVSMEDEARERYVREIIQQKEAKMRRMQYERDLAIQESRMQAQTTADLREHLRRTLSPETFDRKVARAALEMRISNRPPTASPTMNRSHIFLG